MKLNAKTNGLQIDGNSSVEGGLDVSVKVSSPAGEIAAITGQSLSYGGGNLGKLTSSGSGGGQRVTIDDSDVLTVATLPQTTFNLQLDGDLTGTGSVLFDNTGTANLVITTTVNTALGNATFALTANNTTYFNGQAAAFYLNAGNLNAGTLPAARLTGTYNIDISGTAANATFAATAAIANNANNFGGQLPAYYLNAGNLTGTLASARLPAFTGDITTSAGSSVTTLATVNSNVGSFGSATATPTFTVNAKGLITAAGSTTITPAWSSITSKPTTLSGYGITDAQGIDAGLTSLAALTGAGVVTATSTDTFTMRAIGASSSTDILDRAAGDSRYALIASAGVSSFNTRTGAVTLTSGDVTTALTFTPLNAASYTAADVLSKLLTVDGSASGLDADLLDGQHGSYYANSTHTHTFASLTSKPTTLSGYGITDAQGLDAGLTSLAALTGAGVVVATSTDTFVMRNIGITNSTDIPDRSSADSRYARGDASNIFPARQTIAVGTYASDTELFHLQPTDYGTGKPRLFVSQNNGTWRIGTWDGTTAGAGVLNITLATLTHNGSTVWTAGNFTPSSKLDASAYTAADVLSKLLTVDGSGSALDADLLDGQQGSYYQNAGNLNAGTLLAARMPALTGDITTSAGAVAATLATVNSNVGSFGSATATPTFTVNAKGLITAAGSVTVTPAWSSITSKPTTLSGYGITDAQGLDSGLTSLAALTGAGVVTATSTDTFAMRAIGAASSTDILDRSSADARYALVGSSSTFTANPTVTNGTPGIKFIENDQTAPIGGWQINLNSGSFYIRHNTANPVDFSTQNIVLDINNSEVVNFAYTPTVGGSYALWHSNNDGAGSNLDADLLDGQQGSYYQNAGNLNAGTILAARMPALTGDVTTSAGAVATTLATVNSNVGSFGSATAAPTFTVNAKGLITAAGSATITPAWSSITSKPTTLSGYSITAADVLATLLTVDGTGSSLDADLLDGQGGSYYQDAGNLNAGTILAARMPAHTGDVTSSAGSTALTLATVNGNVGSFGSATAAPTFTVNAKGLITAAGSTTITPAWSSITSKPTTLAGYGITDAAANTHKYHEFANGQYFFDSYAQGRNFRLFTENALADTIRFGAVSNVEYYNGSSWTAWAGGTSVVQSLLNGREEGGASISHTNRQFRFEVTANTGWPLMALLVLQSTWTAITYPNITVTIEKYVSGSWVTKDTAVFTGANTGSDWGMHVKATTALHDGATQYRFTIDISDWTDSGAYTTVPLLRLMLLSNYVGAAPQPWTWNYNKVVNFLAVPTVNGANVWTSANDGASSTLDADLLDGQHGSYYQNASNLNAGTILAARMPALTGDITTSAGAVATTLATVNSNVGSFGSATAAPTFTVNAKGLITAAGSTTITPAWSSITSKPTTLSGYSITAADVLATLLTVDGTGSLLDADLLDGMNATSATTGSTIVARDVNGTVFGTNIVAQQTAPAFNWNETDGATNARLWTLGVNGGVMTATTLTDAYGVGATWLTVTRSGTTVSSVALAGTAVGLTGATTVTGGLTVTGGATVGGTVTGNTFATGTAGGTLGYATIQPGSSTRTGYFEFRNAATTRYGYMGFVDTASPTINMVAENSASWAFTGNVGLNQNLTVAGTSSFANNVYMTGATSNALIFNSSGVAAPTFTTRSAGTKLVLYPSLTGSSVDYSLGIEGSNLWFATTNNSTAGFKWYGGTTLAASLSGAGALSLVGGLTATTGMFSDRVGIGSGALPTGVYNLLIGDGIADKRGLFRNSNVYALGITQGASNGTYFIGASATATPSLIFSNNSGVTRATLTDAGNLTITGNMAAVAGTFSGDVAGASFSGVGTSLTALNASNLSSGTVPAAQMPAYTGDATSTVGTVALTLATVNSNVGSFGSATAAPTFTVNAKGLITAAGSTTITPAWSSITSKPTTLSGYSVTAADVLATLLTVDGVGSLLDADTIDGYNTATSATVNTVAVRDASGALFANTAAANTSDTQVATTEFVTRLVTSGRSRVFVEDYGAVADNSTIDNAAAISAAEAAAAIMGGAVHFKSGATYYFKSQIGGARHKLTWIGENTSLVYNGASTTIDLIKFGDNSTSYTEMHVRGFSVQSLTNMTAGCAVWTPLVCRSLFEFHSIQGQDFSATNGYYLYNGIYADRIDQVRYVGSDLTAKNNGFMLRGALSTGPKADCWVDIRKIFSCAVGFLMGGAFGGAYLNVSDYIINGIDVLANQSLQAEENRELFLNNTICDGATNAASASIVLDDPGALLVQINGPWIASGAGHGIWIKQSTGKVVITNPRIWNFTGDGIRNDVGSSCVVLINGAQIHDNDGWGINPTVSGHNTVVATSHIFANSLGDLKTTYAPASRSKSNYADFTDITSVSATFSSNILSPQVYIDSNYLLYMSGGNPFIGYDANDYSLFDRSVNRFSWFVGGGQVGSLSATGLAIGPGNDTYLARDAGNILAMRNGVNAQTFRLYNTFTDGSNYERASLSWGSNVFSIRTGGAGTGSMREFVLDGSILTLASSGTNRWQINASGHLLAATDNTYDIGASGATRPRNAYVGTSLSVGGAAAITASAPAVNVAQTWNNAAVTFTGALTNITSTASAAASLIEDWQVGGVSQMNISKTGLVAAASGFQGPSIIANSALYLGSGLDVIAVRDGADIWAQRRTTNAQTLRVYNTYTDSSNGEWAGIAWSSNVLRIGTNKNGTGSTRVLQFVVGNTDVFQINGNGHTTWNTDNTFDIGASGATRPRAGYFGTSVTSPNYYVDGTFVLQLSGGNPIVNFDSNDYLTYDRTNNALIAYIGGTARLTTNASATTFAGNILPSADNTYNLGSTSARISQTYAVQHYAYGASPVVFHVETDQGTNGKVWGQRAQGGVMTWGVETDAYGSPVNFLSVTRSGTTVTALNLAATAVTINSQTPWLTGTGGIPRDQWLSISTRQVFYFDGSINYYKAITHQFRNNSDVTVASIDTSGNLVASGYVQGSTLYIDATAYYTLSGSNPVLGFDANDYMSYNRSSNILNWVIGGTVVATLDANRLTTNVPVNTAPKTVATLPTGTQGDRGFVTDATATTFASIVAGGGSNKVPVYHDGTNWRIG